MRLQRRDVRRTDTVGRITERVKDRARERSSARPAARTMLEIDLSSDDERNVESLCSYEVFLEHCRRERGEGKGWQARERRGGREGGKERKREREGDQMHRLLHANALPIR